MIGDLDLVALTRALPEHALVAGDVGAFVHCNAEAEAYEVEAFAAKCRCADEK